MATTDYIQTTESLIDFAVSKLSSYGSWTVAKYPGSDVRGLFKYLPELSLPAAVVCYSSSSYANRPRRKAAISVLVAAEFNENAAKVSVRALMDTAISLLDNQVSEMALFRVVSDKAVDCGSNVAAYLVDFQVEDH